tara:strand:+ start:181 stop:417 length:237 start_codon:yes stop_codon:yes gene_type:complete
MTDKQKVYYGVVCLEETVEQGVIKVMEESEEFEMVVVDKPVECVYLDRITMIPEDNILTPEEPLWVQQQENKKLWRKI